MKSIPMVGLYQNKTDKYVLVAIEDIVDESVDYGGFTHSLIAQEDDLVLEEGWNTALTEVEVADVCHVSLILKWITECYKLTL